MMHAAIRLQVKFPILTEHSYLANLCLNLLDLSNHSCGPEHNAAQQFNCAETLKTQLAAENLDLHDLPEFRSDGHPPFPYPKTAGPSAL